MKDIVIIGAGGLGREVAWLIEDINEYEKEWNILGFVDDNIEKGTVLNGYEVLGNCSLLNSKKDIYYICAIANTKFREDIVNKIKNNRSIKAAKLIHPSAVISKESSIGRGCIICAGVIISVNSKIGEFNIIDWNSTIGHDDILKDFVTLYPSVNISGACIVNEYVEIGTGSKIIPKKIVGKNSVVGAGTVVIRDIKENVTAVGVPGRIISNFNNV